MVAIPLTTDSAATWKTVGGSSCQCPDFSTAFDSRHTDRVVSTGCGNICNDSGSNKHDTRLPIIATAKDSSTPYHILRIGRTTPTTKCFAIHMRIRDFHRHIATGVTRGVQNLNSLTTERNLTANLRDAAAIRWDISVIRNKSFHF
ncbi:hypothetical protein NKH18_39345 [Streptomyces sp. M10(2022)]